MSSTNCLHSIEITNLQNNDIVPHQYILLKGKVDQHKCSKLAKIELDCGNHNVLTTGLSEETGKFKFLLDLGVDDKLLHLRFQYCSAKYEMCIVYKQRQSLYKIQPLVIVAQDESVDDKVRLFQQIVDLNLLLIQSVYAEKLNERYKQRLCFVFNDKCQIFKSHLTKADIWQLAEHELWTNFAKELLESHWGNETHLKFVSFISCSKYLGEEVAKSKDYSYGNIMRHIRGHAACGAGGLALFSCTYFYAWPKEFKEIFPCFVNTQALDMATEPDDSNYRKTRAGVYASSLGAVCHEIGHIFDLGHDMEGVMGSNFDYINHIFTLNKKTEHLPERIIQGQQHMQRLGKPRFTQLKNTPGRNFLDCYREQKENDSFYFTPNSAIILCHHPWLRSASDIKGNNDFKVSFNKDNFIVKSENYAMKLIEIRRNSNSLVTEWFEFQKSSTDQPVFHHDLTRLKNRLIKDSHIFIMSICGHIQKLTV